jgi:hypothetical protein
MDDKAKQAKNDYMKAYRAKNKDKLKEINNRYWSKKAEQIKKDGDK